VATLQFDLYRIEQTLREFQNHFTDINAQLSLHREAFSDEVLNRLLVAYDYLNELMAKKVDLFSLGGVHSLLELNHRILCGHEPKLRFEYHTHILETRKKFHTRIGPLREWVCNRGASKNPYHLVSGFYCRMLTRPQLFIEGNHRTGNLAVNYLLASRSRPPYLISASTAYQYLELSGRIKFANLNGFHGRALKLPKYHREFCSFFEDHADSRFVKEKA